MIMHASVISFVVLSVALAILIAVFWDTSEKEDDRQEQMKKDLNGWWEHIPPEDDETEIDEREEGNGS